MLEYVVLVAAFASIIAAFVYIRSMFRGDAKPNRVTWLMWSVAPFIATAAALTNQVGWAALPIFMAGLSPFLIFVASFISKKAYWRVTPFDYICGLMSALALVFWVITREPNIAIVFAIAIDGLAAIPTIVKAWHHPETESVWLFIVGIFNASTSFVVAERWTFSELAFPAYLIAINLIILFSIYWLELARLKKGISSKP